MHNCTHRFALFYYHEIVVAFSYLAQFVPCKSTLVCIYSLHIFLFILLAFCRQQRKNFIVLCTYFHCACDSKHFESWICSGAAEINWLLTTEFYILIFCQISGKNAKKEHFNTFKVFKSILERAKSTHSISTIIIFALIKLLFWCFIDQMIHLLMEEMSELNHFQSAALPETQVHSQRERNRKRVHLINWSHQHTHYLDLILMKNNVLDYHRQ